MRDWASELRAIADGRLLLNVRNGVTVSRSMLAKIADELEAMSTALAARDAELEAAKAKCQALDDECQQSMLDIARERDRAERAEAQLAEANKALDAVATFFRCIRFDRDRDLVAAEAFDAVRAARRALEAQGGE